MPSSLATSFIGRWKNWEITSKVSFECIVVVDDDVVDVVGIGWVQGMVRVMVLAIIILIIRVVMVFHTANKLY